VAAYAGGLGLTVRGVVASPLPGPSGNVEFFLWLRRAVAGGDVAGPDEAEIRRVVEAGVTASGPMREDRGGAATADGGGQ